jgi:hypothetical protein
MIQFMTERVLPFSLTLSIQIFAVSSMLMVGLRYTLRDLIRPLRDVRGVVIALATNSSSYPRLRCSYCASFHSRRRTRWG